MSVYLELNQQGGYVKKYFSSSYSSHIQGLSRWPVPDSINLVLMMVCQHSDEEVVSSAFTCGQPSLLASIKVSVSYLL